jgi:hypothetical protein
VAVVSRNNHFHASRGSNTGDKTNGTASADNGNTNGTAADSRVAQPV